MQTKPISSDKIAKLDSSKVNPRAFYKVQLQVGGSNAWRGYKGQVRQPVPGPNGQLAYPYRPSVHDVKESVTGEVLSGLIEEHNLWLDRHSRRAPQGEVDYQIVVLGFEQTDESPPEFSKANAQGMYHVAVIEHIINKLLDERASQKKG